jgi:hypothetical protein
MQPALLTRSELEWLQGSKQVSAAYARQMRSRLYRKLDTFQNLELPLLIDHGFNVTIDSHSATASSNGIIPDFDDTIYGTADFSQYVLNKNEVCKRPGRDSNPGRRSDSPPYWTGLYEAS